MNISEIMTTRIVTVLMDDSLYVVKDIFDNAKFHHLLVVEDEKLAGVLSDRDLLKAISPHLGTAAESPEDTITLNRKVHQIMSRKLISLSDTTDVKQAIDIFTTQRISCIPVTDECGKPIGIVSWRDILRSLQSET